jgi:glycosyltransferase 2 family protein
MNESPSQAHPASRPPNRTRRIVVVTLKAIISAVALAYIYKLVFGREGFDEVKRALGELRWHWFGIAIGMQLCAISCGVVRWRLLLGGQGLHAPWRFLAGSWMIGRFWGAVTPGGLGLDGWRFYDTVQQTGKIARALAVSGVEKILGQLGFGAVVVAGSLYGFQFIGLQGLLLVNGFFVVLVATGLTLLARPQLFRVLSRILPMKLRAKVETLVDAVCAYHGEWRLLAFVALLSMAVHIFNNLIYVCAARALGVELSAGIVFFGSSLQILATILPGSINGIGLREAAAIALYTSPSVGLSATQALLIPTVGFAAEMLVSACGMPVFLARRRKSESAFTVDASERERPVEAQVDLLQRIQTSD